MNKNVQAGVIAMRDPDTGAFLEAQPIYEAIRDDDTHAYNTMIRNAGTMFAQWIGEQNM